MFVCEFDKDSATNRFLGLQNKISSKIFFPYFFVKMKAIMMMKIASMRIDNISSAKTQKIIPIQTDKNIISVVILR